MRTTKGASCKPVCEFQLWRDVKEMDGVSGRKRIHESVEAPRLAGLVLGKVFAVKSVLVTYGLEVQGVEHRRLVCGRPHPGPTHCRLVSAGDE
jgi:hypothetical protein